jgi:glycosyltransferase involved in cell wall biosynthesis
MNAPMNKPLCYVLTNYPLSTKYKSRLENELGLEPHYVTISELRHLPLFQVIKRLRHLRGETLLLPLEDENSVAILPILEMMAAISGTKRIEIVLPDGERKRFFRRQAAESFLSFLRASARGLTAVRHCNRELTSLIKAEIVLPQISGAKRVLFLNANLWFGVKAGGSVGHISGVINGFLEMAYDVDFLSAGSRLMVRPQAKFVQLEPPHGYGLPYDGNFYAFHRTAARQVNRWLKDRPVGFLYQRLSVSNYTGVLVSRKYRIPLVMEYNGSEVWVAGKWSRPLSYPKIAELAEEACLRHAHVVVTVSDVLRDELVRRGVPAEKIVSYPNCIDEEIFNPERFSANDISNLRARYGLSRDAMVIGFLGTFGQWHGVEIMGEAIRLLATQAKEFLRETKVHFLIIGDGIKMSRLREILSHEECRGLYTLPGLVPQEEAPLHLAAADILLSPHISNGDGSSFFGSPTKLFEYMAMGKPIIASDLDQIGHVLQNSIRAGQLPAGVPNEREDRIALLIQPGSVGELVESIRFLSVQPRWRERLGANARAEALSKYTWKHHVSSILKRLRHLGLL